MTDNGCIRRKISGGAPFFDGVPYMMSPSLIPPKRPAYFFRLGLAALMTASLIGCASMDENKKLQTAVEQARAQLAEAENQRQQAVAESERLQAEIARLQQLLNTMQAGGDGDRDRLLAQIAKLQDEREQLLKLQAGTPALPIEINNLLRELAAQYPTLLEFDERLGMVRFKSDLTFDLGSTVVKPDARRALAAFAKILTNEKIASNDIQVVGHTDDVPISAGGPVAARNPDNATLSTNRAWAVALVLKDNGVGVNRLMASGWGDQRPIAPNAANYKGNAANRRVDIYIRPTTVPVGIVVSTGTPPATRPAPRPTTRSASTRPSTRPAAPATRPGNPSDVVPIPN